MAFSLTSDKDRNLYAKLTAESIKIFGLNVEYWRVDRDQNKDTLYGEDTKPLISAKYDMKMYGEVIEENWMLTRFGIETNDDMELVIDRDTFEEYLGDNEVPNSGDFVYVSYLDRIFIISDVKDDEENVFLQNKFVWKLMLSSADLDGEEVTPDIGIDDYEDEDPVVNDATSHAVSAADFIRDKIGDTNPFGEWD